jgi:nitrate reductase NapE component
LALTVLVFLYETARWNVEWIAPVTACFLTVCIYPVLVFFGLKLVMTITRFIKKTKNKVALITWIPLQMILLFASLVIMTYLRRILEVSGELYGRSLRSELIYSYGGLTTLLLAMVGVTIVGFFVLYRYEYGSRKFLVHCAVWYAVYLALTVLVFLYETARWNVEWIAPVTSCFLTVCIYPVMAFFGLKLVIAIVKGVRWMIARDKMDNDTR